MLSRFAYWLLCRQGDHRWEYAKPNDVCRDCGRRALEAPIAARSRTIERASVNVKFSSELLEELKTWSQPIQIRAEKDGLGEWTLICRLTSAQSPERVFYEIMHMKGQS